MKKLYSNFSFWLLILFPSCLYASPVNDIQALIHQKGAHWVAREPDFSQLPYEALLLQEGKPMEEEALPSLSSSASPQALDASLLPDAFDWTAWMTRVRDQRSCGACTAFAAVGLLEGVIRIETGYPTLWVDLSEQFAISCSGGTCTQGIGISTMLTFLRDTGTPDEPCLPYYERDDNCSWRCPNWANRVERIDSFHWITSGTFNDLAVKTALLEGPVITKLDAYEDLVYYGEGIYQHVWGSLLASHCVVIVGWDDANQYWIAKNSWGTGWGEHGYLFIRYQNSNIAKYSAGITYTPHIATATPTLTPTPTTTPTPTVTPTPTPIPLEGWGWANAGDPCAGLVLYGNKINKGMAGHPATATASTEHVLCHFDQSSIWYTGLVLSNPSPSEAASVTLYAYDADGNLLGDATTNLPAQAKVSSLATSLLGLSEGSGWLHVTSDNPILSFEAYGNKVYGGLASLPSCPLASEFVVPHFHSSDLWWSGLALANPADSSVPVVLAAYDQLGILLDEIEATVPPKGKLVGLVDSLFALPSADQSGWISVAATDGTVAGMLACGKREASPNELAALPGIASQTVAYATHFTSNPSWWTGVAWVNPSSTEDLNVTLRAQAQDGTLIDSVETMLPPLTKILGTVSSLFTLGAHETGWIEADGDGPLVGLHFLHAADDSQKAWGLAGLPSQQVGTELYLTHYKVTTDWWTLFALANPSDTTAISPTLTLWKNDGSLEATHSLSLPANGQLSQGVEAF